MSLIPSMSAALPALAALLMTGRISADADFAPWLLISALRLHV